MLDKHAILDAADITVVVEELGIPFRHTSSSRIQILCPCHDDHNFGSCYLDTKRNTFKCFACGAYGDVFALVQAARDIPFMEAVRVVADICGGEKLYEMSNSGSRPRQRMLDAHMIPVKDREFIGLHSNSVYRDVGYRSYSEGRDDETAELMTEEAIHGQYIDGYRVMKREDTSPLSTLLREDPVTYHKLIDDFCIRTIEKYQNLMQLYKRNNIPDQDLRRAMAHIKGVTNYREWVEILTPFIKRAQEISKKYGYGEAVQKEQSAESELIVQLVNDLWEKDKEAPF